MKCSICEKPATHKIAEDVPLGSRHPFTNYVCCEHFGMVMGKVAQDWCNNNHIEVFAWSGNITINNSSINK